MSLVDNPARPVTSASAKPPKLPPPRRSAPFDEEPGFHEESGLWFYGNIRLLHARKFCVAQALGKIHQLPRELDEIERKVEEAVLDSLVLVTGVHNPAHQRAAVVPLRWGAPRILVVSGGFYHHFGEKLNCEPFRSARLWRYEWDSRCDLAISRRAPHKLPTYAQLNRTVDRLVSLIAHDQCPGICSPVHSLTPCLN